MTPTAVAPPPTVAPGRAPAHARGREHRRPTLAVLAVLSAVVAVVVAADLAVPGRLPLVLAFALTCPGAAVAVWLRLETRVAAAVTLVVSVAVFVLAAMAMLLTGWWHPVGVLAAEAVVCAVALGAAYLRLPGLTSTQVHRPWGPADKVSLTLTGAGTVALVVGHGPLDPDRLGPLGSAALFPVAIWVGLLLLAAAAAFAFAPGARPASGWAATLVAATFVSGYQSLMYTTARSPVAWLHWGFIDQIATTGHVLKDYDARFSWPGFFAGFAVLDRAAGSPAPDGTLHWSQPVLGLLAAGATWLLARAVLGAGRRAVLATFVFVVANSIGQDYFSPQALTYTVVLATTAVAVELGGRGRRPWLVTGATVIASLALAPTHQLSPLFLVLFLGVLAVQRKLAHWWLPAVPSVITIAWWATGARDFFVSMGSSMLSSVGSLSSSVSENVGSRFAGDPGRQLLQELHLGLAAMVLGLAVLGLLVSWRSGAREARWTLAGWGLLPFGMVVLQPYGGEMLLRALLFALPGLAMAIACGAETVGHRWPRLTGVGTFAIAAMLLVGNLAVRGQDDSYYVYSAAERAAADTAYAGHPHEVTTLTPYAPSRFESIGTVRQDSISEICPLDGNVVACVEEHKFDRIVVNRGSEEYGRVMMGLPDGWGEALVRELVATGRYRVVWHEGGCWVVDHTR